MDVCDTGVDLRASALGGASGGSTGHLCPLSTGRSPSPFPFFSHPLLLIQAVYSGGVVSELRALQQPGLGY
eukprot:scaffold4002_cov123-Isochrysis_galbana.AAC.13